MSEQQPLPPKSDQPTSPPLKGQPSGQLAQLIQVAESIWRRGKPVAVTLGAKLLETVLLLLNWIQQQLEKEAPQPKSPKSGPASPDASQRSAGRSAAKPRSQSPATSEETAQQILNRLQDLWLIVLGLVRSRLPQPLRRTLPDSVLTAALSGILLLVLWVTSFGFPGLPKATVQAPGEATPPPQLVAPKKPVAVVVQPPEPEVTPTPVPLQVPPEQKLIAQIQDQVSEVTDRYTEGLIQSVQANFKRSRLIVKVGAGWYDLDESQQDRLAQEVLQRTQKLEFEKLEMTDDEGTLVARSPVVGDEMIILQRRSKPLDRP